MGLLEMLNKGGGLFDPIAQPPARGFDLQKMMADTPPTNMPTFAPPEGQSKGGVFGSGFSGEDILSILLRAGAIAQGDNAAGAQFGANIGAKARAEAEAAQQERQWRERKQWEWDNTPKDAPTPYRWRGNDGDLMELGDDGSPRTVFDDPNARPQFVPDGYGSGRWVGAAPAGGQDAPTVEDGFSYTPGPGGKANQQNWKPVGGGASNGTGGFPRPL